MENYYLIRRIRLSIFNFKFSFFSKLATLIDKWKYHTNLKNHPKLKSVLNKLSKHFNKVVRNINHNRKDWMDRILIGNDFSLMEN